MDSVESPQECRRDPVVAAKLIIGEIWHSFDTMDGAIRSDC